MPNIKLYELKKDIVGPHQYIRAGHRKSSQEWLATFPQLRMKDGEWDDWFIEVKAPPAPDPKDIIAGTINNVFSRHGLHSVSYKDACKEVVHHILRMGLDADAIHDSK